MKLKKTIIFFTMIFAMSQVLCGCKNGSAIQDATNQSASKDNSKVSDEDMSNKKKELDNTKSDDVSDSKNNDDSINESLSDDEKELENNDVVLNSEKVNYGFTLSDFSFAGYGLSEDMYDQLANSGIENVESGELENPFICVTPFDGYETENEGAEWNCYFIFFEEEQYYCLKQLTLSEEDKPHYKGYTENFDGPIKTRMSWEEVTKAMHLEEVEDKAYDTEINTYNDSSSVSNIKYRFNSDIFGEKTLLTVYPHNTIILENEDNEDSIYISLYEDGKVGEIDVSLTK